MARCPHCGAPLGADESKCDYCNYEEIIVKVAPIKKPKTWLLWVLAIISISSFGLFTFLYFLYVKSVRSRIYAVLYFILTFWIFAVDDYPDILVFFALVSMVHVGVIHYKQLKVPR